MLNLCAPGLRKASAFSGDSEHLALEQTYLILLFYRATIEGVVKIWHIHPSAAFHFGPNGN